MHPSRSYLALSGLLALSLSAAAGESRLIVTNKGDHTLSIIDPQTRKQVAAVDEQGTTGHEVIASADGARAFVPIFGNSGVGKPGTDGQLIQVIDLAAQKIIHTIDFGRGVRPHLPVLNAQRNLLFVTTEIEQSVAIIDPATYQILGTVSTGQPESHMLAVSKDGRRGYTANVGPGTVSVMDLERKELIKVIPVSKRVQRISLSVDDKYVFTANQLTPELVAIDTATNAISHIIPLPDIAYGTAPTPDGKYLVVALINLNEVGIVDLAERKLIKTFPVPKSPQAVTIQPDGAFAYISCDASKQVAVINLQKMEADGLIEVGKGADGIAWAAAK